MNHLEQTVIKDKKVGLRVDLNVPIENGEILSQKGFQLLFRQYFTY